jgi:hypothetical protein
MPTSLQTWHTRSTARLPDEVWHRTLSRVRGEFAEMPCLRVTAEQARVLMGLDKTATSWVLSCLTREGYLEQTPDGQFVRRKPSL